MIKAKKIGLVLDKDITLNTRLKNGMVVSVMCEYIEDDYDRLYLLYPYDKEEYSQYFYEGREIEVVINTIEGLQIFFSQVIYEPKNNLIVIEYSETTKSQQKRQDVRVKATKMIDVLCDENTIPMVTIDLSAGGAKLLSQQELTENYIYEGRLHLFSKTQPIHFSFKVLRCSFINAENKYELITEFTDMKELDKQEIVKFCYNSQLNSTNKNYNI